MKLLKIILLFVMAAATFQTSGYSQADQKLMLGDTAPTFYLRTLEGEHFFLSKEIKTDSPIILAFYATWCIPCRQEIPALEKVMSDPALDHVRLIGEYNKGVRKAHRIEKGLAVTAMIKALTTRAARSKRKTEANNHAGTMAAGSMKLVSRKPEDLRADLLAALDDLNDSNLKLPKFSNALPDYSKN